MPAVSANRTGPDASPVGARVAALPIMLADAVGTYPADVGDARRRSTSAPAISLRRFDTAPMSAGRLAGSFSSIACTKAASVSDTSGATCVRGSGFACRCIARSSPTPSETNGGRPLRIS